eukprot:m51a1_g12233 hypothetical protein (212) ;mRNA; f:82528-83257
MEIEVKLRLADEHQLQRVRDALATPALRVRDQRNVFLDCAGSALRSARAAMRLRFYTDPQAGLRCLATLKESAAITGGVMTARETEEFVVDASAAQDAVSGGAGTSAAAVAKLVPLVMRTCEKYKVSPESLVVVGSFTTRREAYPFAGKTLELDCTTFAFGTAYEVEVEAPANEVQKVRTDLEALFDRHGIRYTQSTRTKFACLLTGSLEP